MRRPAASRRGRGDTDAAWPPCLTIGNKADLAPQVRSRTQRTHTQHTRHQHISTQHTAHHSTSQHTQHTQYSTAQRSTQHTHCTAHTQHTAHTAHSAQPRRVQHAESTSLRLNVMKVTELQHGVAARVAARGVHEPAAHIIPQRGAPSLPRGQCRKRKVALAGRAVMTAAAMS